jgi:hypothetical protein
MPMPAFPTDRRENLTPSDEIWLSAKEHLAFAVELRRKALAELQ